MWEDAAGAASPGEVEVRSSDESRPRGGAGASSKNEALYETEDRHRYVHQ